MEKPDLREDNWIGNASFSKSLPRFQTALDSTSLGSFKLCPRYYYYTQVLGLSRKGSKVDLDFGTAAHKVVEWYHKYRINGGCSHENALENVVVDILQTTWNHDTQAPAFDDPQKNRLSLVRFAVEYLDHYEKDGTGPRTIMLENGRPAVELSFAFDSGIAVGGEPILLCGHLDRIVEINEEHYIADIKTTRSALGSRYAHQFTPDNQFTLYTLAGLVALGTKARGVLLDAAQIGTNFVRFARFLIPRPQGVLNEWLRGLSFWVHLMKQCADESESVEDPGEAWPQNDKACGLYGGCQFREVCGRSPQSRRPLLAHEFESRRWDPIGDPR